MMISQTPLRISFAGGGTDFPDFFHQYGGTVVSSTIDKYIYVIIKERFDNDIVINYSRKEIVTEISTIEHELVRGAMHLTGTGTGVEITTLADIPSRGSGLGSSSSVTVGLLHACHAYNGTLIDAKTLAREACQIEIDMAGKPIGYQDQYIAAFGHLRRIRFEPGGDISVNRLSMNESQRRHLGNNLLLFFTGRTRSSDTILAGQKRNIRDNREHLKALSSIAEELVRSLEAGDIDAVGDALHEGWALKRRLAAGISDPEIDESYERARHAGAVGGKIAGAGGGGFLLLYVPGPHQESVRAELGHLRELPFHLERDGSKIIFSFRQYETK